MNPPASGPTLKSYLWMAALAGVGLVLIVLTSVVEGLWTLRWDDATSEELRALVAAVGQVPLEIPSKVSGGGWDGHRLEEKADPKELEVAGAEGHFAATYQPRSGGEPVQVYLICGRSRSVSVHTPDACYPGAGFTMEGQSQKYFIPYQPAGTNAPDQARTAEFTTAVFVKSEHTGTQRLRVFWAWNAGNGWQSPDFPRWVFGGRRPLNKLYLIAEAPVNQTVEDSPCVAFAKDLLPELDQRLFPEAQTPP